MRKLVTHFSLRLGLELSGEGNCIELRPILWGCKMRNPQNSAGSVPQTPTSANILIQKKEQKSLLLEFVIDFASLVFHCVGSAITSQAELTQLLRFTASFPHGTSDINRHHWQVLQSRISFVI